MALTKIVASRSGHRTTLIPFSGIVDDGSTLSLDFTTGVLDPRLTFTRSTNATFINSSGLVQYADANLLSNSVWTDANATPTNWTLWTASGGTVSIPESGLRTISATAASQQPFLYQNYLLNQGLSYTISVVVTNVSGSVKIEDVLAVISASSIVGYYVNGILQTNTTNQATAGKYAVVFVASGASHSVRFGAASQNLTTGACSITMHSPRLQPGIEVNPSYVASQIGSSYQGPRFDYDQTPAAIGTPRGLLIEASAVNVIRYSQDFSQATWSKSNATATLPTVAPDGTTTAYLLTSTTAAGVISQTHAPTGTAVSTYSIYVKQGTAAYCDMYIYDPTASATRLQVRFTFATKSFTTTVGTNPSYQELKDGWFRLSANPTALSITNNIISYLYVGFAVAGTTYYAWGAQLEAGSAATSYIPTGASQGSRAADKMSMNDITTMQWNQEAGTFFLHMNVAAETSLTTVGSTAWLGMYTATPVRVVRFKLYNGSGTTPRFGIDTWASTPVSDPAEILSSTGVTRPVAPTIFKYAAALSNTGQALSNVANNGTVVTATGTGTMPTPTRLLWHQDPSQLDSQYFPVHLRSMKYWPTNLPNDRLQAITT